MIDLQAPADRLFAAIVEADDAEFEELMAQPESRERIIDVLVTHLAGSLRPEEAGDLDAVIHVKLWDRPEGGYDHRELVIRERRCAVSATPREDPDLTLKIRPGDLRKIVSGEAGPKRLAFQGRLRAIGEIRLGMRLSELFDLSR